LITLVWVSYAVVFFGTIARRRIPHIYVANWFFGAFILTIALLHVVNSAAIPVTFWKSYSVYAGVQDAMVQWWYGHNAVGFFLTAGFLGIMYYFIPKQAERPIYTIGFFAFWLFAAGSSAFTCFLQRPAADVNRICPLEPPARPVRCPKRDTTGGSCD
jgi:cytochrome c oxidase cbb3-type subunit 1